MSSTPRKAVLIEVETRHHPLTLLYARGLAKYIEGNVKVN